jgi:hypothetical protein
VGTFLFFGRAVDPTLAAALSSIASQQNKGTEATMNATKQLLDYIATHHYLSEYCGKSRAAAYMFLTKKKKKRLPQRRRSRAVGNHQARDGISLGNRNCYTLLRC